MGGMNFAHILSLPLQSIARKAEVAPLYIQRKLTPECADKFVAWAKSQGFDKVLSPEELHVTITFSKKPVDWSAVPVNTNPVSFAGSGPGPLDEEIRTVEPLGDQGAVVLKFSSSVLQKEHRLWREAGASWDYPEYQPHVSITYKNALGNLDGVKPYDGPLDFGPQLQESINDDYAEKVVEKFEFARVLKKNPYHDEAGRFSSKDRSTDGAATELLIKPRPALTSDQLIDKALPREVDREDYRNALAKQSAVHAFGGVTYKKHSVNGDGTGGYTPERKALHTKIIQHLMEGSDKFKPALGEQPTMVILGGRGGSGKSNFDVNNKRSSVGVYDSKKFMVLDSDKVKELIPEYTPETASVVHAESSAIFSKLVQQAKAKGLNVVLDITMKSPADAWVTGFRNYGYKVEGYYMHRPADLAVESAIERWNKSSKVTRLDGTVDHFEKGRLVPPEIVLSNVNNERNFDRLTRKLDKWGVYDNSGMDFKPKRVAEGVRKFDAIDCTEFSRVLKANPYRDAVGKFTSKENAVASHAEKPTLVAVKAKLKAALAGTWVAREKEYSNTDGHTITRHTHHFYSTAQAEAGYEAVRKGYSDAGYALTDDKILKPGEANVYRKNSMVHVKIYHALPDTPEAKAPEPQVPEVKAPTAPTTIPAARILSAGKTPAEPADKLGLTAPEKKAVVAGKLTAKEKHSQKMLEQSKTELEEKYLSLSLAAANLKAQGKNSAAKLKLQQLETAKAKLEKYGMPFEDSMAFVAAQKTKFSEHKLKLKEEHLALTKNYLKLSIADGSYNNGYFNSYSASKETKDAHEKAHVFGQQLIDGTMSGNGRTALHLIGSEKHAAIASLEAAVVRHQVEDTHDSLTGLVQAKAKLKTFGMKDDKVNALEVTAMAAHAGGKVTVPKTVEEAHAVAVKNLKDYYKLKSSSSWQTPVPEAAKAAAHAKYLQSAKDLYKLGGSPENFGLSKESLKVAASEEYYAEKHKKNAENIAAKTGVSDAAEKYQMSKFLNGDQHPQTVEAKAHLNSQNELHRGIGVPDFHLEAGYAQGKQLADVATANIKATAKTSIAKTAYAYEFAKLKNGLDHPDTQEAAHKMWDVATVYGKHLTTGEVSALRDEAASSAAHGKKMMDQWADLGDHSKKTAEDYDATDHEFTFPFGSDYKKAEAFKKYHDKFVENLSPSQLSIIKDYTGSGYKDLNRKVGTYGTAVMMGKLPESLPSYIRKNAEELDDVFKTARMGMPVRLVRNMPSSYLFNQLGIPKNPTVEQLETAVGKIYKETAFSSSSMKKSFDASFSSASSDGKVKLQIRAGAQVQGIRASSISSHGDGEAEVILARGMTYVVRKVEHSVYGTTVVHVDALGAFPDKLG